MVILRGAGLSEPPRKFSGCWILRNKNLKSGLTRVFGCALGLECVISCVLVLFTAKLLVKAVSTRFWAPTPFYHLLVPTKGAFSIFLPKNVQ